MHTILLMHVGGGQDKGSGIHSWHIDPAKNTMYLPLDRERQEIAMVRVTTLWLMPSLVFVLGVVLLYRRKRSDSHARSAS